jgi:oligosaccharide repeat unit polymerase
MIQSLANPLSLFFSVWGAATVLYLSGVFLGTFPSPQPLTVFALLLNLGAFTLGYLTWSLFQSLPPRPDRAGLLARSPWTPAPFRGGKLLTRKRLIRALQIALLVGVAAVAVEFYRLALLARHFNTSWSYLVVHPSVLRIRLVQFIGANIYQPSVTVMLLSLTNSIFSLGFVLLGVFLYQDRTWWRYVYLALFLLISMTIGLLHLSRYEMTANILFLVFAYCFLAARDRGSWAAQRGPAGGRGQERWLVGAVRPARSNWKLIIPVAAIAVLFLLIDLLLRKSAEYGQVSRLQGFAYHLYWYMASPLAALNEFLVHFQGDYGLGRNTFFPLYKWLCRFHLAHEVEVSVFGERVQLAYSANVYTYLRSFYEDFGLAGVALAPYVLGGITAALQQQARRYVPYLNLYLVLLMLILFSFYNYFLFSTQAYLQILVGFLFFRYEMASPAACGETPATTT